MRTSVPGSKEAKRGLTHRTTGFTLIELLVVLAVIAISVAMVSLAMRDPQDTQLEREAERLAALLEMARAEARADGLSASWAPVPPDSHGDGRQFRFAGLPEAFPLPARWLAEPVSVQIVGATRVQLGPEPFIGAQRIVLSLGEHRRMLATDGLAPFSVVPET